MKHHQIAQLFVLGLLATLIMAGSFLNVSSLASSQNVQQQKPTPTAKPKPKPPKLTSRVVLVSISGLRADFANNPDAFRLKMPTIQSLRTKGSYAVGIESVYPSQTKPAHTSIATGVLPADHGITSDYAFEEQAGLPSTRPHFSSKEIKAETIWDAAKREDLITATVGYPLTADAAINFNLPEVPTDAAALAGLIQKERPHLILINFTSFDIAQRRFGLLSKEALTALELIDGSIKKITEAIEQGKLTDETTVFIVSDYGVSSVEQEFRPNVLLSKKGFLTTDEQGNIKSWRAVAQGFGGSAAIFIKNPQDEAAIRDVEKVFRDLEKESDNPLWRITLRRDAARLGADPRAAIYLDAAPKFTISPRANGSFIGKADERVAHGYLPSRAEMRATLIIAGKGIKANQRIEYARLIDIAPTIARLLGLEMKSARGRVLSEVIAQ